MQTIALRFVILIISFFLVYLALFHHNKSLLIRSDVLLILNVISFGIFIAYMYESPEYASDSDNKLAEKMGITISDRNLGRVLIVFITLFYLYTTIDLTHRVKTIKI